MSSLNWTCPHCERHVTIVNGMRSASEHGLYIENADGPRVFTSLFVVCPNPECRKFTLQVLLSEGLKTSTGQLRVGTTLQNWRLVPDSAARAFPDYIPEPIRDDYVEACKIRELSPKASATLARRCLQGILRDYWEVKPGHLAAEIAQIEPKVDALTWEAIQGVRKIGNIGAHMEKDVNTVLDVEPKEAGLLIQLIETVIDEWYIARHAREQRMRALVEVAAKKGKVEGARASAAAPVAGAADGLATADQSASTARKVVG